MARIPFDLKWKPQIESGEYRVETRDGKPVRIICWDMICTYPIVALCNINGEEWVFTYDTNGHFMEKSDEDELFLVTTEEKLTEFEQEVSDIVEYCKLNGENVASSYAKRHAKSLLSYAREQFIKDGYVIEKKAIHDAVEKIDPEVIKEVSENIDLENFIHNLGERYPEVSFAKLTRIAKAAYAYGKADALKDLPRWKKIRENGRNYSDSPQFIINGRYLEMNDTLNDVYEVALSDLEKLPKEG